MGFYSIKCTDYLHPSPIIPCIRDSDRIISVHCPRRDCTLSMSLVVLFRSPFFFFFLPQWSLTSEWPRAEPTPRRAPQTGSAAVEPEDGAPRQFKTPKARLGVCPSHERWEARTLHIPPSISCVHEFTSGGHQAGFTTGQQKHVILRRTPYLGAYVRENQVHVPLISIIHHKLCKGAIGRAKP